MRQPKASESFLMVKSMNQAANDLFEKFALKQRRDLEDMYSVRASPLSITDYGSGVTCLSVAGILKHHHDYNYYGYQPRTGVLFYAYDDLKLHSWLINETGLLAFHSREIKQEDLDQCIQEQRLAMGVERLQKSRTSNYRKLIAQDVLKARKSLDEATIELSEILIPSAIASALSEISHLIIIPVSSLGIVPFAMLKPFTNKEVFLIDVVSLSIAPSLFDLAQLLNETFSHPDRIFTFETPLIIGISEFPQHSNQQFSLLPGVRKEIEDVAKELGVAPLFNSQATKAEIYAKAGHCDLFYLATHGFADEHEGYLVLWDAIWSGQEIHDLRFENAYIAILSACQTGLGRVHDAGMIGVARSFQMGGIPRVVVSPWSVKDEETAFFMVRLVQYIRHMMVAEALRATILDVRQVYPDPAVWASFSLFGTPR